MESAPDSPAAYLYASDWNGQDHKIIAGLSLRALRTENEQLRMTLFGRQLAGFNGLPWIIEEISVLMSTRNSSSTNVNIPAFITDVLRLEAIGNTCLHNLVDVVTGISQRYLICNIATAPNSSQLAVEVPSPRNASGLTQIRSPLRSRSNCPPPSSSSRRCRRGLIPRTGRATSPLLRQSSCNYTRLRESARAMSVSGDTSSFLADVSSRRGCSPKRRRVICNDTAYDATDEVEPAQSASQTGSESVLSLTEQNTFAPPTSYASSSVLRPRSPTRETSIILKNALPPVLTKSSNAASKGEVSHTTDTFIKRTALFSGFEIKPASGVQTEAELQISIWSAASIRKKQELVRYAKLALNPAALVEPMFTIVGHEHHVYYCYPRDNLVAIRSGVHVLGPDSFRFERLSTDSVRGIFRLLRLYGDVLGYGANEEEDGYWGGVLGKTLNRTPDCLRYTRRNGTVSGYRTNGRSSQVVEVTTERISAAARCLHQKKPHRQSCPPKPA
ncbi:hypothetical protein EJ07DRAFT_159381 [Lizonia empirigonia]|nr:hypothetical protein EJ07DRAFT_159381 [Lizonia empirigonia]